MFWASAPIIPRPQPFGAACQTCRDCGVLITPLSELLATVDLDVLFRKADLSRGFGEYATPAIGARFPGFRTARDNDESVALLQRTPVRTHRTHRSVPDATHGGPLNVELLVDVNWLIHVRPAIFAADEPLTRGASPLTEMTRRPSGRSITMASSR